MLGKCYKKLNRPPKVSTNIILITMYISFNPFILQQVLEFFVKALENAPQRNAQYGSQGKILEPIYKLCSVLAKYLYKGEINVRK